MFFCLIWKERTSTRVVKIHLSNTFFLLAISYFTSYRSRVLEGGNFLIPGFPLLPPACRLKQAASS